MSIHFDSKHVFSLILPFTVLIVVPFIIENNLIVVVDTLSILGAFLVVAGLVFISIAISMFIKIGKGTLAPWHPTRTLIVSSIYAYVRNPMITCVLTILLGEALIFHSIRIFIWFTAFFFINHIYFVLSEEPGLKKRFGAEYLEYKRNVPRWIPMLKPWKRDNNDTIV